MNKLLVIDYLKNNSFYELMQDYPVKIKPHKLYPELLGIKYDKGVTTFEPLTRECRGIIINKHTLEVVYYGLSKFDNYNPELPFDIPLDSLKVYDKEDDTMIGLYFYKGEWNCCTTGNPDAICTVNLDGRSPKAYNGTFKELFFDTIKFDINLLNKDKFYVFALCTPYNQIVVDRTNSESYVKLLAVRDKNTLMEEPIEDYSYLPTVKSNKFNTLKEIENYCDNIDGLKQEGFVLLDTRNFNRIKIKGKDYVLKHYMITTISDTQLFSIVIKGDTPDDLEQFPNVFKRYTILKDKYEQFKLLILKEFDKYKHIKDRKEFALSIKNNPFNPYMFYLKDNKDIDTILRTGNTESIKKHIMSTLDFTYYDLYS